MRGLIALMASTFVAVIGQFMVSPWLVFRLDALGTPVTTIGWFSAASWIGLLVSTPFTAGIVRRIGQRNALIVSLAVALTALATITTTDFVPLWALMTFLAGIAMSVRWVVTEAVIAELAPVHRRGRIVGLYQTLLGAAFILAPTLIAWLGPANPHVPVVAMSCLATGLALSLMVPHLASAHRAGDVRGWRGLWLAAMANPSLLVAGFLGGFFELGVAALLPVYGMAIGFTSAVAAMLIATSGIGSALMMLPTGEAADRLTPRRVSLGCATVNLLACLALPIVPAMPALAWPLAFIWGGAGGALYTLAMIELGHRHRGVRLISATALLVMSYTMGGLCGPIVSGYAIDMSIGFAFPIAFASIAGVGLAALWLAGRQDRRDPAQDLLGNEPVGAAARMNAVEKDE